MPDCLRVWVVVLVDLATKRLFIFSTQHFLPANTFRGENVCEKPFSPLCSSALIRAGSFDLPSHKELQSHHSSFAVSPCCFADIAIGAPFAGEDRRGKVLIYNGASNGLNSNPSQVLSGMWASQSMPAGFGFTLRGDSDIDKNDYPGKILLHQRGNLLSSLLPLENASFLSCSFWKAEVKI